MFSERKNAIISKATSIGCDTVASTSPQNIFYLTGFWGDGIIVINQDKTFLFTNTLEYYRAKKYAKECKIISSKIGNNLFTTFFENIPHKNRICFDEVQESIKNILKKKLKNIIINPEFFQLIRTIKDNNEISIMTEAGKKIDELFECAFNLINPKVSERDIAAKLISKAIINNFDLPCFSSSFNPLIIASGSNSSQPHGQITNRTFSKGDLVVIDIVLRYKGYIIDTTRTFSIGKIKENIQEIYEIVRFAQEEGIKEIKPGVLTGDLDKKVRSIINEGGYGKFFIHSTGHGVGLDVHEPPFIRIGGVEILQKGEVITVEPGIYIPNKFGIRIEDTILVSDEAKSFTRFPKKLLITG